MKVGDLVNVSRWDTRTELKIFNIGIIIGISPDVHDCVHDCYYRIMLSDRITTVPDLMLTLVR